MRIETIAGASAHDRENADLRELAITIAGCALCGIILILMAL